MKEWKCPICFRVREYKFPLVLKICPGCMEAMEVVDDER